MAEGHNVGGSVIIVAVTVGTLHADFLCYELRSLQFWLWQ